MIATSHKAMCLRTRSTEDKSFECHIYLETIGWAKMVKGSSKKDGSDTHSIRLTAPDETTLLTVVVGADGVEAWKAMMEKHGELALIEAEAGDALFSFSDA